MNVEIWSDIFCPWCYIGKRNFENALSQFAHPDDVTVTWKSFQLNPDAPVESTEDMHGMLASKFGTSRAQAKAMNDSMVQRAASVGLTYDLDHAAVTNSFDGHRLSHLAAAHGLQDAAEERLFAAHFTEAKNVGKAETLVQLGKEIGLEESEIREMLATGRYTDAVNADIEEARQIGANGVPFFVFNRKYAVSGAQPPEVLLNVLNRVWEETAPLQLLADPTDEACADGACAVPNRSEETASVG
jgi:predicted DsbA family dithiol-disulfide isomerase